MDALIFSRGEMGIHLVVGHLRVRSQVTLDLKRHSVAGVPLIRSKTHCREDPQEPTIGLILGHPASGAKVRLVDVYGWQPIPIKGLPRLGHESRSCELLAMSRPERFATEKKNPVTARCRLLNERVSMFQAT